MVVASLLAVVLINVEVGYGLTSRDVLHGVHDQHKGDDNPKRVDEQYIEIKVLDAVGGAMLEAILQVGQVVNYIPIELAKREQHLQTVAVITALHEGEERDEGQRSINQSCYTLHTQDTAVRSGIGNIRQGHYQNM